MNGNISLHFHPDHLADLRESGLNEETIKEAGITSTPLRDIAKELGYNYPGITSIYRIPYPGTDFCRFKVFYSGGYNGKPRYLQRKDTGNHLYISERARPILSDPLIPLYITEGEKKTLKACQEGLYCIGLSGLWNWSNGNKELITDFDQITFKNREIYLIPDNDWLKLNRHGYKKNLRQAVYELADKLRERGARVYIINLPEGNTKGLDDFLCTHSIAEFKELPAIEVKDLAERIPEPETTTNSKKKKPKIKEEKAPQGKGIIFKDFAPWPDPVDGAKLLNEFSALFKRHVVLPAVAPEVVSLWVLHTYALDATQIAPILVLKSAEKRSGKTTLLSILRRTCHRPLPASNIAPAALFRGIEKWKPTLLIDEADTFMRDNEELRGILNAGHTRDMAFVIRTVGNDFEPRIFNTWGAKCIALIGSLPATIMDRSIVINMYRKKVNEKVERLRSDNTEFEILNSKCLRWAMDNMEALKKTEPVIPQGLNDRVVDNWTPLMAIAELCGGGWPERARQAVLAISDNTGEEDTAGVMLLSDIKDYFEENETDKVTTAGLITYLTGLEERPWPEFKKGKPITPRQVARLLHPFGISPRIIRTGIEVARGYFKEAFADAFSRYLPSLSVTTLQTNNFKDLGDNLSVTPKNNVTDKKLSKPLSIADCNTVTDKKGVEREKQEVIDLTDIDFEVIE